jgi:hypothetical protein
VQVIHRGIRRRDMRPLEQAQKQKTVEGDRSVMGARVPFALGFGGL